MLNLNSWSRDSCGLYTADLSVWLSVSLGPSACLSVCWSVCLYVCLSRSVGWSVSLSAGLSDCLSLLVRRPVCLSVGLSICLSVYLSLWLSLGPSTRLSDLSSHSELILCFCTMKLVNYRNLSCFHACIIFDITLYLGVRKSVARCSGDGNEQ